MKWMMGGIGVVVLVVNLKQHYRKEIYYNVFTAKNRQFILTNARIITLKILYYITVSIVLL